MYVCILYISTVVCHDMFLAAGNMMLCLRHHIAHSPLCTSCSLFKIKTKADSYMPCEAMAHSTKWWLQMSSLICDGFTLLLVGPGWGFCCCFCCCGCHHCCLCCLCRC